MRVIVLGAGGELGRRVCRIVRDVPGTELLGASRRAQGPSGVSMQRADVTQAASVARLLRAGDLVVNCAGPYGYDASPLVAACVAARAHYCDLADDVGFAERVRAAAQRCDARSAGVFVCTGASTLPGSAGLLAGAFARLSQASEIARVTAYLSVGSGNSVSAALLASLLAPLGRPIAASGRCFAQLCALRASDGRTLRFGAYPAAFAAQRVAIGARSVPARFFFGFDRAAFTALLALVAPAFARLPLASFPRIARALLPFARVAQQFGTPRGLLALVAEDAAGREIARIEVDARARGLDIPAAPPAWIAARMARGDSLPAGCVELSELVPLADALRWLRADPARSVACAPASLLPG